MSAYSRSSQAWRVKSQAIRSIRTRECTWGRLRQLLPNVGNRVQPDDVDPLVCKGQDVLNSGLARAISRPGCFHKRGISHFDIFFCSSPKKSVKYVFNPRKCFFFSCKKVLFLCFIQNNIKKLCITMKFFEICQNVVLTCLECSVYNILVYFIKYGLFTAGAGKRYILLTNQRFCAEKA